MIRVKHRKQRIGRKKNLTEMGKKQLVYAAATAILFLVELCIALFVRDRFIRPYVGDVLVAVLLYTLVRTCFLERPRLLPLYIFLFAAGVEVLQGMRIVELLGLKDNRFFSVLIGTTFDWKDIGCYAAGCVLCGMWEVWLWRRGDRG